MSKPINRITVNALYHPASASRSEQTFSGYLKARITDIINAEAGRREAANAYYPLIFVPFTMSRERRREHYTLAESQAFEAKDITPAHLDLKKKTWEFYTINPPQRERGRLQAILSTLKQNLEEIVEQARPLKCIPNVRRKRFLSQFPQPLREGIDERTFYGTLTKKPLIFLIHEHDLPSYAGEDKIPHGVLPATRKPGFYIFATPNFYKG